MDDERERPELDAARVRQRSGAVLRRSVEHHGGVTAPISLAWRRRRRPEVARAWAVVAALVFWIFPLLVGRGVSLYRSDALVLPVVLLLAELPPWVLGALVIWLAVLAEQMARLFFLGYLI